MKPLENVLLEKLEGSLRAFEGTLHALGLTFTTPRLHVRNSSEAAYESELSVDFFRGKNLVDAIEFHVFRAGVAVAELDLFDVWIQKTLNDVVAQQRGE